MKKEAKNLIAQIIFIITIFGIWQLLYSLDIWPDILFPSLGKVAKAFIDAFSKRSLGPMVLHSLGLLMKGLLLGIIVAMIFSSLSIMNDIIGSIYNLIVSMFDLIPGIALIPVAILWLGIGDEAIIFMVFHSVVWPVSRAIIDGFKTVPNIYLEVGQNIGLTKLRLIFGVFLPAALPRIFSGIKTGWARAWRGLISAEMVFGGGSALGIGFFITDRRTNLDVASIFAAIIVIIAIGIFIEYGIFQFIEKNTFKKWGISK